MKQKKEQEQTGFLKQEPDNVQGALQESEETQENNYLEDLQRVQAEFENYMKRVEKERVLLTDFAKRELLLKMLSLQDEFDVALGAMRNAEDKDEMLKGVEMLHQQLHKMLESEQVREVEALGKLADPYYHEVVAQVDGEDGIVIEEIKKGYMVKDKLLRPSMVKVGNGEKDE